MKKLIIKRVYEPSEKKDGTRILIDRLWPRGVTKEDAHIDIWEKEIAPSRDLIKWFHEDKDKRFTEFEKKYSSYLITKKDEKKNIISQTGTVTLITAVKDIEHSQIPILVKFLSKK